MFHFSGHTLTHLLAGYGYWVVLLFVAGSAVIMAAAGYTLYHVLKMDLEAKDLSEVVAV